MVAATVVGTILLGILTNRFVKPILASWGLEKNWAWPILCLVVGVIFALAVRQKIEYSKIRKMLVNLIIGLVLGVALQFAFYFSGQRDLPVYHGLALLPFFFQVCVSYAEEYLFRGQLQRFLQKSFYFPLASIFVSLPFALIHGLNPVLFNHSSFDFGWFISTFILSFAAGIVYGPKKALSRAFGLHLGYNIIAMFF